MFTTWFVSHLAWIGGFLLAVVLLTHIIRQRRSPAATIAWILFIVMAPYIGVPLYLVFGGRKIVQMAEGKAEICLPTLFRPLGQRDGKQSGTAQGIWFPAQAEQCCCSAVACSLAVNRLSLQGSAGKKKPCLIMRNT